MPDSEHDICHADLQHRILPPAVPTLTFPARQRWDCPALAGERGAQPRLRPGRGAGGARGAVGLPPAGPLRLWGCHRRGPSSSGLPPAGPSGFRGRHGRARRAQRGARSVREARAPSSGAGRAGPGPSLEPRAAGDTAAPRGPRCLRGLPALAQSPRRRSAAHRARVRAEETRASRWLGGYSLR